MTLEDLKLLFDTFGPGGGLIVTLGLLAVGVILPVLRRERVMSKTDPADLVTDRDILIFMTEHNAKSADFERRLSRVERKCGD